jgi:ATP phosphoribosyltransferase
MRPTTPRGFRDALFQEAAERRVISDAIGDCFESWGYGLVETPAVEEYRTLEAGAGSSLEGTAFRLFDVDGTLLALRPEMTLPIARLVATRLAGTAGPYRMRYTADVYREHASLRGEARQFTQAGIELVGLGGPASDAEVVSAVVEALAATGLREFTVGIGTVAVLNALLDASRGDGTWRADVMAAAHKGDLVGLERLTRVGGIDPAVAVALRAVPRIGGGADAVQRCREAVGPTGCAGALDSLAETWRLLEATGVSPRVRIDFGIMRSFDYYTGLIVEAYAPGLGVALGGGGRYDEVLAAFGAPMPAAGVALSLERVQIALREQGVEPVVRGLDAVIGGPQAAEVLLAAARLRASGSRVRVAPGADAAEVSLDAARQAAARALFARDGSVFELDAEGRETGEVTLP